MASPPEGWVTRPSRAGAPVLPESPGNPRRLKSQRHQRALELAGPMRIGAFEAGNDERLFLIAGPCVIESEALAMETAETLARIAGRYGIGLVYKSSFDKANRDLDTRASAAPAWRPGCGSWSGSGPRSDVPVLTDVHEDTPLDEVASSGGRAPDPGVPLPPDELHPGRGPLRQAGEHQEGPVPRPLGHGQRGGQGESGRQPPTSWSANGELRSDTTTSSRTCARWR